GLALELCLVEARWKGVDQIDIAGELTVLFARHAARNKNTEMADRLVDRIDDGLAIGADFVEVFVEIEDPSQRLMRRCDIVALRAKYHDRRANVPQIDRGAVRGANIPGRQIVANEQFIDNELDLLGVEIDMAAPPALKAEIAGCFRIDF